MSQVLCLSDAGPRHSCSPSVASLRPPCALVFCGPAVPLEYPGASTGTGKTVSPFFTLSTVSYSQKPFQRTEITLFWLSNWLFGFSFLTYFITIDDTNIQTYTSKPSDIDNLMTNLKSSTFSHQYRVHWKYSCLISSHYFVYTMPSLLTVMVIYITVGFYMNCYNLTQDQCFVASSAL